jgi:hypothetical protein
MMLTRLGRWLFLGLDAYVLASTSQLGLHLALLRISLVILG